MGAGPRGLPLATPLNLGPTVYENRSTLVGLIFRFYAALLVKSVEDLGLLFQRPPLEPLSEDVFAVLIILTRAERRK